MSLMTTFHMDCNYSEAFPKSGSWEGFSACVLAESWGVAGYFPSGVYLNLLDVFSGVYKSQVEKSVLLQALLSALSNTVFSFLFVCFV